MTGWWWAVFAVVMGASTIVLLSMGDIVGFAAMFWMFAASGQFIGWLEDDTDD